MKDFLLVDLSFTGTKAFDGMAAGKFTDMWGRETVFLPEELPDYVRNTKLALSSTLDTNGQIVGFPIDTMNHDGGEAAGWIIDVNLAVDRNVIQFSPRWNLRGTDAIGSDTMRYFSPTIDIEHKTIIGGSLTNWPATRTPEHQILLRPVELSAQMQTYTEAEKTLSLWDVLRTTIAELKTVLSGLVKPVKQSADEAAKDMIMEPNENLDSVAETTAPVAETIAVVELQAPVQTVTLDLTSPDVQLQITQQAEARAAVILAEREHTAAIAQLATRLTGGTPEKPTGLPVGYDRLLAFLQKLPAELYPEAEAILTAATERGLISFTEAGHSRIVQGTQPLPDAIKPILGSWLSKGLALADFFEANSDQLGAMSDYNLSEFIQPKKE